MLEKDGGESAECKWNWTPTCLRKTPTRLPPLSLAEADMGPLPTDRFRSLQVPGSAHQDTGFPSRLQLRSSGLNMEGRMVRDALADMIGRPLQSGCVVNGIKAPPRAGHLPQDTSSLCTDIPSLSSKGMFLLPQAASVSLSSYLYTRALSTPKDPTIRSAKSQETTLYSKPQIRIPLPQAF